MKLCIHRIFLHQYQQRSILTCNTEDVFKNECQDVVSHNREYMFKMTEDLCGVRGFRTALDLHQS